ncbi:MAG: ABC transporter substrate-binding protein [Candidatus Nitrosocosmicus sp.]
MDYKIKLGISGLIVLAVIISSNPTVYLSLLPGQQAFNTNFKDDGINSKGDSLKIGFFPNLNHAQAIIGIGKVTFNNFFNNLSDSKGFSLQPQLFSSGQSMLEALYAGKIDAAYVDASSIIQGFMLLGENEFRIVSGAASGGASFVVRNDSGIEAISDLGGKVFATPHLGGIHDVALRKYLIDNGLNTIKNGGNITVINLKPIDIISKFQNKEIDGAWVPEPIVAILKHQGNGEIFVDERDLWPGGEFISSNIIVRTDYLEHNPDVIKKLLEAHVNETIWLKQMLSNSNSTGTHYSQNESNMAASAVSKGLMNITGKTLTENQLVDAMSRIEYTWNPLADSLLKISEDSKDLGYIIKGFDWNDKLLKMYDLTILNKVLAENKLKQIEPIQ